LTTLKARPTVYNGVQMRSRLEARAAYFLDEVGVAWQYEPRAYKDGPEEYLPDFQIAPRTFIEVKPANLDHTEAVSLAIAVLGAARPDFHLWVLLSNGRALLWRDHADLGVWGYLAVCRECHRWTLRPDLQSKFCACGAVPIDAKPYLEWAG